MPKKALFLDSIKGYAKVAQGYNSKESYLNTFEKGAVLPIIGDVAGKKILDVGAGTGRLAIQLQKKGADVTALDSSPEMLEILTQKNKKIITVVGDAEDLPFPDSSFDAVTAAFLIVHLKNPRLFFSEAYRVLKDGGMFLVTNINQKDPPVIDTPHGRVIIESFYHRPDHIISELEDLAFTVKEEKIIKEKDVWINQIIACIK